MAEQGTYNGTLISDLVAMVDHCLDGKPESRQLVKSALESAYFDGRMQATLDMGRDMARISKAAAAGSTTEKEVAHE